MRTQEPLSIAILLSHEIDHEPGQDGPVDSAEPEPDIQALILEMPANGTSKRVIDQIDILLAEAHMPSNSNVRQAMLNGANRAIAKWHSPDVSDPLTTLLETLITVPDADDQREVASSDSAVLDQMIKVRSCADDLTNKIDAIIEGVLTPAVTSPNDFWELIETIGLDERIAFAGIVEATSQHMVDHDPRVVARGAARSYRVQRSDWTPFLDELRVLLGIPDEESGDRQDTDGISRG